MPPWRSPDASPAESMIGARSVTGSAAAIVAHQRGLKHVVTGVCETDYSGYPDCRPEFIAAFEALARLATKVGVEGAPCRLHTPLIALSKAQIIREGVRRIGKMLAVDFAPANGAGPLTLLIHLMSAGRVRYLAAGEAGPKAPAFRLRFEEELLWIFDESRRTSRAAPMPAMSQPCAARSNSPYAQTSPSARTSACPTL